MKQLNISDASFDKAKLADAMASTKAVLSEVYARTSKKYANSSRRVITHELNNCLCTISGNVIATLIRNFYNNPNDRGVSNYLEMINDREEIVIRDISNDKMTDIDIYFTSINVDTLSAISSHIRDTYDTNDTFDSNIKLADSDVECGYGNAKFTVKEKDPLITPNAITMADTTQFILCKSGNNFTETFDFEHCRMRYNGINLFASQVQLYCAINKILVEKNKPEDYRVSKYLSRGFTRPI